ncbi:MAG: DUF1353 domain-containing protein [Nitrosomonadaceae bacterium]
MPFITTSLRTERDATGWTLLNDVIYKASDGTVIVIPTGSRTDLASIPRHLRPWFSNMDYRIAVSAVLHDHLYNGDRRKHADKLFLEALRSQGVGRIKSKLMYLGVRAGGVKPFNKNK